MKTKGSVVLLILAALVAGAAMALTPSNMDAEKADIQTLIETAYLNGAFNRLDTKAMKAGFHPTFKIHGVSDGKLSAYPITDWISGIEKRKAAADFDAADQKWEYKFAMIDATGNAGMAKIELFRKGKHVYTDYLSVLKLADGWKITDKVYFRH